MEKYNEAYYDPIFDREVLVKKDKQRNDSSRTNTDFTLILCVEWCRERKMKNVRHIWSVFSYMMSCY